MIHTPELHRLPERGEALYETLVQAEAEVAALLSDAGTIMQEPSGDAETGHELWAAYAERVEAANEKAQAALRDWLAYIREELESH